MAAQLLTVPAAQVRHEVGAVAELALEPAAHLAVQLTWPVRVCMYPLGHGGHESWPASP